MEMDISTDNQLSLVDLPNEIFLMVMKKLNMIDVLYSFVDLNERWNDLVLNPLYVHRVDQ